MCLYHICLHHHGALAARPKHPLHSVKKNFPCRSPSEFVPLILTPSAIGNLHPGEKVVTVNPVYTSLDIRYIDQVSLEPPVIQRNQSLSNLSF